MTPASQLREKWAADRPVLATFLTGPDAWAAELMTHAGYEVLVIDIQHGLASFTEALAMMRVIAAGGAAPMARVTWNDPAEMMKLLDAGAAGIICPMINDRAGADAFVSACRYPPVGFRSYGPVRLRLHHPDDFERPLTFAMIETAQAMENLDAIAATPGLDGLFIGPYDLTLSMGFEKMADFSDQRVLDLLLSILEACRRYGIVGGLYTSRLEDALWARRAGFGLVSNADETTLLKEAAKRRVDSFWNDL
jgi:4-hydroxy-2-oxoheptanedioate aldolase